MNLDKLHPSGIIDRLLRIICCYTSQSESESKSSLSVIFKLLGNLIYDFLPFYG